MIDRCDLPQSGYSFGIDIPQTAPESGLQKKCAHTGLQITDKIGQNRRLYKKWKLFEIYFDEQVKRSGKAANGIGFPDLARPAQKQRLAVRVMPPLGEIKVYQSFHTLIIQHNMPDLQTCYY
jgi:hypothetical protein